MAVKYYSDDWPTTNAKMAFEKYVFTKTMKTNARIEGMFLRVCRVSKLTKSSWFDTKLTASSLKPVISLFLFHMIALSPSENLHDWKSSLTISRKLKTFIWHDIDSLLDDHMLQLKLPLFRTTLLCTSLSRTCIFL